MKSKIFEIETSEDHRILIVWFRAAELSRSWQCYRVGAPENRQIAKYLPNKRMRSTVMCKEPRGSLITKTG